MVEKQILRADSETGNTKQTKVNISIALSRNFDKITLELLDEPIEHNCDEEFQQQIQLRYDLIKGLIEKQFASLRDKSQNG